MDMMVLKLIEFDIEASNVGCIEILSREPTSQRHNWFEPMGDALSAGDHHLTLSKPQWRRKTFMVHHTFVWWALYILYKFVKSPIKHLVLAIRNAGFLPANFCNTCNRTFWPQVYQKHIKFTSIYTEIVLKFRNVQGFQNFNRTMSWNLGK